MNDATFSGLRAHDGPLAEPSAAFARQLRRQLETALEAPADTAPAIDTAAQIIADTPSIDLPERTPITMTDSPTDITAPATQILTPYISVHDGAAALDWYTAAFGAVELVRYVGDDGRLGHAEFTINGARVMLSDAYPEMGVVAANSYDGSSCALHVEVPDCDAIYARAMEHGATSAAEPADQPHGARSATIFDPFGHRWMLSQQVKTLSSKEINERYDDFEVIENHDR